MNLFVITNAIFSQFEDNILFKKAIHVMTNKEWGWGMQYLFYDHTTVNFIRKNGVNTQG